jgi:hypothetical protein
MILTLCSVTRLCSCYKDPAELVLFHDVEMKGHIREGSIRWKTLTWHPRHSMPGSFFENGWVGQRMVTQFSGAHLSVQITRCDPKIAGKHYVFVFRIKSVAAAVAFNDSRRSVAFIENASRFEQEFCPRFHQRTLEILPGPVDTEMSRASMYRRLLRSPLLKPSSTGWKKRRRTSSRIPCQGPWRRAGAAVQSRRSSASLRRSSHQSGSTHKRIEGRGATSAKPARRGRRLKRLINRC